MGICQYVREALKEMQAGASLERFLELRYWNMAKACPHGVFSVEQASLDFFDVAHRHIMGTEPLPVGTKDRPLSEYDKNYIAWIKLAQTEKA